MSTTAKVLLVAGILIVLGAILAGCGLFGIKGDWSMFNGTSKMVTVQDTITEDFNSIDINVTVLDVELLPSDNGTCYYVERTWDKLFSNYKVENGTLKIGQDDARQWYDHIGIYSGNVSMKLYLPKDAYEQLTFNGSTGDLSVPSNFTFDCVTVKNSTGDVAFKAQVDGAVNISCSTGDVAISEVKCGNLSVSTSTGDVDISVVKCDNLSVSTGTGHCQMDSVNVAEKLLVASTTGKKFLNKMDCGSLNMTATTGKTSINNVNVSVDAHLTSSTGDWMLYNLVVTGDAKMESSTGDWDLDNCDAANIKIKATTGHVEGTLRSEKIFFVDTDTGDVDVPRCTTGGTCDITTDTGDIDIEIVP